MISMSQFLENDRKLRKVLPRDHNLRGESVQIAEKAADGIIVFFQSTGTVDIKVGRRNIKWSAPQVKHQEWPAQLNRFFQIPALTEAYAQTKDRRYAEAARDYIEDWIHAHPTKSGWRIAPYDNTLNLPIRIVKWLDGLGALHAAPVFDEAFAAEIFDSCAAQLEFLCAHLTQTNNWRIAQAEAILNAGIWFSPLPLAKEWISLSVNILNDAFHRQVLPDGVHIERNPGYHSWMARIFAKFWRLGCAMPGLGLVMNADVIAAMYDYSLASTRPNGSLNGLHDCQGNFAGRRSADWSSARSAFRREAGLRDCLPLTSQWFPNAGQACLRDSWEENAVYVTFDATTWGGSHCHLSRGAIGVHAFGRSLLVDPGTLTYEPSDPMMAHGKSTVAHNTINLNGWNQSPADPVNRFGHAEGYDLVTSLYEGGYWPGKYTWSWKDGFGNGVYGKHHRKMLWIHARCIIVIDDVFHPSAGAGTFLESNWQFAPGPLLGDQSARRVVTGHNDANLLLSAPLAPEAMTMTVYEGQRLPLRGWLSGQGDYVPAPQVSFRVPCLTNETRLVTVLIPFAGQTAPNVVITASPPQAERGGTVKISWPDGSCDVIFWTAYLATAIGNCDSVNSDASLLHLLYDERGAIIRGLAVDASYVLPESCAAKDRILFWPRQPKA